MDTTRTDLDHLDRQGRSSLKSLLGLSKYSKNYVLNIFNISEVSAIIINRRVQLFHQLIKNSRTTSYLLSLLTVHETKNLVINLMTKACNQINGDILDIAINGVNKSLLNQKPEPNQKDIQDIEMCKVFLSNWHFPEYRKGFRHLTQYEVRRT